MLLSLKLRTGSLDTRLRSRLAAAIREGLSAWHVPTHMLQVDDTPYMVNGKKMDILVRYLVNGKAVTVGGAAANPECLDQCAGARNTGQNLLGKL
ncbi:MAG: hypothetical protein CL912_32985 [Deltaproteobacteria bacterium]|nr:hypothetical protein [Deltaproteobacteria bacterium]